MKKNDLTALSKISMAADRHSGLRLKDEDSNILTVLLDQMTAHDPHQQFDARNS